jgi:ring-1,2-phenylacetyl-CoA epoxidase subunit PaaA
MTDPLALDPVLSPAERSRLPFNEEHRPHDERFELFEQHVTSGGKVEATDWMPDEYRTAVLRFVEMHANSELMGVLPEREWIMRAPTLRRKLALTSKVQDEVGHAQLLYRVAEDLGKSRAQMVEDLLDGKTKFHNVFHYPTKTWADIGVIAWLVDAAAIVAQQALRDSSYAPYARTMRKICWEESVHIMHGRDVVVTMVTGTPEQRAMIQEALDRWWGPLMQMHGPRSPREKDRDLHWRIKAKTSEELRQEFLGIYVPRLWELGLTLPDPELRHDEATDTWLYGEPDWQELRTVGHEPRTDVRGTAGVPPRELGRDGVGPRDRARCPGGGRVTAEPQLEEWEVFRQEKEGDAMKHGGSVMAPDAELAVHYARELFGRRQESIRLWVVRRADIHDLSDPDLLQPPLDRSFKKPGGYVMRDKLAAAREQSGASKPKGNAG